MLVPCVVSLLLVVGLQLFLTRTFIGRAIMAVAQDQLALQLMAANPIRIKRIAFGISIATAALAGAFLIIIQPVEPSVGREYIGRVFAICVLGGMGSLPGTVIAAMLLGIVESFTATFYGPSWAPAVVVRLPAAHAGRQARRHPGALDAMRSVDLLPARPGGRRVVFALAAAGCGNDYVFFAGYVVLQFIVLATAWNILGGYCGYVNFGSAAFFAIGAYTSVALHKLGANSTATARTSRRLPAAAVAALHPDAGHLIGGIVAGIVGFGMGYLTLRLRGVFFAIATLAMAVVLQTLSSTGTSSAARAAPMSSGPTASRRRLHAQLYPVSVPDHARARRRGAVGRAR